jgi:hypothetical protein
MINDGGYLIGDDELRWLLLIGDDELSMLINVMVISESNGGHHKWVKSIDV